jgi:hypothetical protein
MVRISGIVAVGLALSGCVSPNRDTAVSKQMPPSSQLRAQIVASPAPDIKADPSSVRDVEISSVVDNPNGSGFLVCVRGKMRDSAGGFSGRRNRLVPLASDGLVIPRGGTNNHPFCENPGLHWHAMPEFLRSLTAG